MSTTPRTLDDLPFRRMTGGGLDEGGTTGDLAWDWDEWDDVVRKSDVAELLAEARALPLLDAGGRLGEAIAGERRHWHRVEVDPADIEAVLGALTTIAGTLDDILRHAEFADAPEQSAFAAVRKVQLAAMKDVADRALSGASREEEVGT